MKHCALIPSPPHPLPTRHPPSSNLIPTISCLRQISGMEVWKTLRSGSAGVRRPPSSFAEPICMRPIAQSERLAEITDRLLTFWLGKVKAERKKKTPNEIQI